MERIMNPHTVTREELLQRVCAEYLEMPGLRLTLDQAQRLWGLDEQTCAGALEALQESKFLIRRIDGTYARATDGQPSPLRPAMLKADLPSTLISRINHERVAARTD
jgi:hypothetical protein